MSTERADLPPDGEGDGESQTWADRAAGLAASVQSLLATRLAIFREEISGKAALLGRGLAAIAVAAALGVGALLLFAALLAALFAKLFGSVALGILAAMLLYAVGAGFAGWAAFQSLSNVKPNEFPVTGRELSRDWEAIGAALAADDAPEDQAGGRAGGGTVPDDGEVDDLEARLRGGTD